MVTPDGCTLSNPASQEPTINCSQPGGFTALVMVTDALGAVLGAGSHDVSVAPQPAVASPDAAAREKAAAQQAAAEAARQAAAEAAQQAAAEAARKTEANRVTAQGLRDQGTALQQQGKLREAVAKYRESLPYYPDPKLEAIIGQLEAEAVRREKAAQAPPPEPPAAEKPKPPPPKSAPPPAKPAPPPESEPEPEACQITGTYDYLHPDGSFSFALRQSGNQLDGTLAITATGMGAAKAGVRGSISRGAIRLTVIAVGGEESTLTGTASNDCRSIRASWTMDGETQTFTLVKK